VSAAEMGKRFSMLVIMAGNMLAFYMLASVAPGTRVSMPA